MQQQDDALPHVERDRRLAEAVRAACLDAARRGYEDAQISGLCHEGAWESAVSAIQMLDVDALLKSDTPPRTQTTS